jgi:hypothetical protein
MHAMRAFVRSRRRFAALVVALALAMKALVPAGYMIWQQDKVLTITICADASGTKIVKQIMLPQSGQTGEHAKAEGACPYAALGMAALSGADAALVAGALGFILPLGFAPVRVQPRAGPLHLRPPLRGPPALA